MLTEYRYTGYCPYLSDERTINIFAEEKGIIDEKTKRFKVVFHNVDFNCDYRDRCNQLDEDNNCPLFYKAKI